MALGIASELAKILFVTNGKVSLHTNFGVVIPPRSRSISLPEVSIKWRCSVTESMARRTKFNVCDYRAGHQQRRLPYPAHKQ